MLVVMAGVTVSGVFWGGFQNNAGGGQLKSLKHCD
jgi:hypothetical protein